MSLLQELVEHSVDDDYYRAEEERAATGRVGRSRRGAGWASVCALAGFAVLITLAAVQTRADRPAEESERAELISQIGAQRHDLRSRQDEVAQLRTQVSDLRESHPDLTVRRRVHDQRITTGTVAVTGPGVQVTVDNAEDASAGGQGRVLDQDLQRLVNGLWLAGAEAIAINGNRLTALSSIRTAGEAITVNYKSLSRPYVVRAIGDPKTLEARFMETAAGEAWTGLHNNLGMRFDMSTSEHLVLPAAPHKRSTVRVATTMEENQ